MRDMIIDTVLSIINANIENGTLTRKSVDENLIELGMDSITFIEMVVAIEERFECEIPDEKLLPLELDTVSKIVNVLETLLCKR